MLQLTDLRLPTSSISETTAQTSFKVLSANIRTDEAGTITDCALTCRAIDGVRQNFKLPASAADSVKDVKAQLDKGCTLRVKFERLQIRPFAFVNDSGRLLSGVSTKAERFDIVQSEDASNIDIDDIIE